MKSIWSVILLSALTYVQPAAAQSSLNEINEELNAWRRDAYRTGEIDKSRLAAMRARLDRIVASQSRPQISTRLAVARNMRLAGDLAGAIRLYSQLAAELGPGARGELAFEVRIGLARSREQANDIGGAASAYDAAIAAAGARPSQKQAYEIAGWGAAFLRDRGELEAALVASIEAIGFAGSSEDRYFALEEKAQTLTAMASSCDDRPLFDAASARDLNLWSACLRAVAAADGAYAEAGALASQAGWTWLAGQVQSARQRLGVRRELIEANANRNVQPDPRRLAVAADGAPLVHNSFRAPRDDSPGAAWVTQLIDRLAPEPTSDPLLLYIQGLGAETRGNSAAALERFRAAATALAEQRSGYFDVRRRGTVIERHIGAFRNLALILLDNAELEPAFATFETIRSRGLGELAAAIARPDVTLADREWLRQVTLVEAQISGRQVAIVRQATAGAPETFGAKDQQALKALRLRRTALLGAGARQRKFAESPFRPAGLTELQESVRKSSIPVLLYWTDATNVVVWVVGPRYSEVRGVFLPERTLADLVQRVANSARTRPAGQPYDTEAAKLLYRFLIEPFAVSLDGARQVVIVPQGEVTKLPFEALVDPQGRFAVERWAFSYAPSATLAVRLLNQKPAIDLQIRAIADPAIPGDEVANIAAVQNVRDASGGALVARDAGRTSLERLRSDAKGASILHILAHGRSDGTDPLLSELRLGTTIHAADLLGLPLAGTRLVVLSACESGVETRRISNELFGFPWALIIAGAENSVVSRWRIDSEANAEWMRDFYGSIGKGESPAIAAAEAARSAINDHRADPSLWAAMQVFGR